MNDDDGDVATSIIIIISDLHQPLKLGVDGWPKGIHPLPQLLQSGQGGDEGKDDDDDDDDEPGFNFGDCLSASLKVSPHLRHLCLVHLNLYVMMRMNKIIC